MSQASTYNVPTAGPVTPAAYATRDNESLAALLSAHRGSSRPSYAVAGTIWAKNLGTSPAEDELYYYDGADDILIGTIDRAANTFYSSGLGNGFTWDSTNERLGVSNASPAAKIDITMGGNADAIKATGSGATNMELGTTGFGLKAGVDPSGDGKAFVWSDGTKRLALGVNETESLGVDAAGRVVVGGGDAADGVAFQINNTDGGMMLPSLTTAQREAISDASPDCPQGTLVWDNQKRAVYGWDGFYTTDWRLRLGPVQFANIPAHGYGITSFTGAGTDELDLDLATQLGTIYVDLTKNITINTPTNAKTGMSFLLMLQQDGTGSRTVTWSSAWKFPGGAAPTLSTAANAIDLIQVVTLTNTSAFYAVPQLNFA